MASKDVQLELLGEVRITMPAADPSTCTPVSLDVVLMCDFAIVFVGWSTYDNLSRKELEFSLPTHSVLFYPCLVVAASIRIARRQGEAL